MAAEKKKEESVEKSIPVSEEPVDVYVDLYSTAKFATPLVYGVDGTDSVTVPPRGTLKRLNRAWLVYPLPAGIKERVQS